jgi:hypothetical protein
MMKYPSWLVKIPHFDKLLHAVGAVILYTGARWIGGEPIQAVAAVTCILLAKEYWDGQDPENHTKDWWDFGAGFFPLLAVFIGEVIFYG